MREAEALDEWHCGVCLGTHSQSKKPAGEYAPGAVVAAGGASAAAGAKALVLSAPKKPHEYYTGPCLPDLPDDLLTTILKDLGMRQMQGVTMVSSSWHTIAQRENVWKSICGYRIKDFTAPRRNRKPWMRLFMEQMVLRERRIEEAAQRMFLKCDVIFRARTDNFSKLRKVLLEFKVGDEIHIDRTGGSTWEDNSLVNLATREGRSRCVKELVEHWGASIEVKDEGGFTPVLEAAYHGHEGLLKYLLSRGANIDVEGVSLGTQKGDERSQNGPFTPLEWARRQGHRRCMEILQRAGSKPAREQARALGIIRSTLSSIIDTIEKDERANERDQTREQREVADVVRRMVLAVERAGRADARALEAARRRVREAATQQRTIARVVEGIVAQVAREEDRERRQALALERLAERERLDATRAKQQVAYCVERMISQIELPEVQAARGAAQCVERMIRQLERRENALITRQVRGCVSDLVRRVVVECDPDQGMGLRPYLALRGLEEWYSHLVDHLEVRTPAQARAVTAADLRRLGTDFLNVTMEESTIEVVLERLVMKIDAAAVAAYHANNSGRRQRAAAEKEKKAAATARLVLQLCSLLAQHGGYRALSAVDCRSDSIQFQFNFNSI